MRAFIFVTYLAVALARPEAGYTYSSGSAQNQIGLLQNAHIAQPHVHQQLPQEHSFAGFAIAPQMTYVQPSAPAAPEELRIAPIVPAEPMSDPTQQLQQQDSYNMAHLLSSLPHEASANAGYSYAPVQTKVHKHIYVHVPPKDFEEEDAIQPHVHHQIGPKQKHYKIVFIKAPSAPSIRNPIVAPPPQNEEKTLIYVLHKRPEVAQDIIIPTAAPTKPSKPEVYFIKYKTKKEEAPVYGPPPGNAGADPRRGEPLSEYSGPSAVTAAEESFPVENSANPSAPLTTPTNTPTFEEPAPQQFVSDLPAVTYGTPTMTAFVNEETAQPTLTAPTNQYMAPELTTVVEKQHAPAPNYGPPTRFFIKKK